MIKEKAEHVSHLISNVANQLPCSDEHFMHDLPLIISLADTESLRLELITFILHFCDLSDLPVAKLMIKHLHLFTPAGVSDEIWLSIFQILRDLIYKADIFIAEGILEYASYLEPRLTDEIMNFYLFPYLFSLTETVSSASAALVITILSKFSKRLHQQAINNMSKKYLSLCRSDDHYVRYMLLRSFEDFSNIFADFDTAFNQTVVEGLSDACSNIRTLAFKIASSHLDKITDMSILFSFAKDPSWKARAAFVDCTQKLIGTPETFSYLIEIASDKVESLRMFATKAVIEYLDSSTQVEEISVIINNCLRQKNLNIQMQGFELLSKVLQMKSEEDTKVLVKTFVDLFKNTKSLEVIKICLRLIVPYLPHSMNDQQFVLKWSKDLFSSKDWRDIKDAIEIFSMFLDFEHLKDLSMTFINEISLKLSDPSFGIRSSAALGLMKYAQKCPASFVSQKIVSAAVNHMKRGHKPVQVTTFRLLVMLKATDLTESDAQIINDTISSYNLPLM